MSSFPSKTLLITSHKFMSRVERRGGHTTPDTVTAWFIYIQSTSKGRSVKERHASILNSG